MLLYRPKLLLRVCEFKIKSNNKEESASNLSASHFTCAGNGLVQFLGAYTGLHNLMQSKSSGINSIFTETIQF